MKSIRPPIAIMLGALCATSTAAEPRFLDSGKVVKGELPFSEAVEAGSTLYLSGQVGLVPDTQQLAPGGIAAESRQAMENIKTVLQAHGYGLMSLVKCTVFLVDLKEWGDFNGIYKSYFQAPRYPARSAVGIRELAMGARVEVECIATK